MSWKPNKAGQYLYSGQCYDIESFSVTHNFEIIRGSRSRVLPPTTMTLQEQIEEMDGPWSLLSPDWQEGAPSAAQLDKWKWWYMLIQGFGGITVEVVDRYMSPHGHENLIFENEDTEWVDNIIQSAPVQEDMNNGPLWVPLEVAVEKT